MCMKVGRTMAVRGRKKRGGSAIIQGDLLKIELTNGQSIHTSPGSLVYMRGDIEKGEVRVGSIGKAFARSFGGEDFFLTRYVGGEKGGTIALSLTFPGDVAQIIMQPNESYRISKGCFLASTDNIQLSAVPQWKGIIGIGQDEGVLLPLATCIGDRPGVIWLGGYGSFEKHELKDDSDVFVVDNGIFLACPNEMQYNIVQLGRSLWSTFAGGEGFGMEFRGPGVVYTQSRNFNDFMSQVSKEPPKSIAQATVNTVQDNIGKGIGNAMTSWLTQEGGQQKRRVAAKQKKLK